MSSDNIWERRVQDVSGRLQARPSESAAISTHPLGDSIETGALRNVYMRMSAPFRGLSAKCHIKFKQRHSRLCSLRRPQQMAGVILERPTGGDNNTQRTGQSLSNGKVFITRHGERADLADEEWLAQAEVRVESVKGS